MKRWMHKIEVLVDKAILPCLGILLIVIILELGFADFVEHHHLGHYVEIADYFVIFVFVLDLIFKYIRVRRIPTFIKRYWLDIIAVFPFFLVFRTYEFFAGAFGIAMSQTAQTAQAVVHEGLELEKEGVKVAKEVEKAVKMTRNQKFIRFLKPITKIPRFVKAIAHIKRFYEKPNGKHHEHEYMHPATHKK